MKLVNNEYGIALEFDENKPCILVIEEKQSRINIVDELNRQCMGEEGHFVLSDKNKILKMNKEVDMLLNPFCIDYNNRKILGKLYQEIEQYGNEQFYNQIQRINGDILMLFDMIMHNVPYNITTALDFDMTDLCKLYNVQLEMPEGSLIEKILDYIKIMNQLCSCRVFVLLSYSMYLSTEEMKSLYEFASYQKVYLLFIEYILPDLIGIEKVCIIDKDGCIIQIGENNLRHLPDVVFGDNLDEFEV